MWSTLRYLCLLYVLCSNAYNSAYAHEVKPDSLPVTITHDSSTVTIKQFDKAAMDILRSNPDFQYEELLVDLSWWDRFKRWIIYKIAELMTREGSWSLLKNAMLALGIAALLYLIMKLLGMDIASIFSRKAKTTGLEHMEYTENIHTIDFDGELQKAIQTGNYRLAVRLLYLDCLKKLSDYQLIDWQPAKTNANYINELSNTPIKDEFRQLTKQFEYVWYGDFGISQRHFTHLHEAFQQFDKELK